ncbi:hypothetical protein [Streptomyces cadmiisoli]|uniref:Uncharacterized protein n=1 Tax=Streptomyces cadmiisoli TaxID=2184053 RepID=A0A2Z4J9R6_9ACTN|nr:hypothetical protein [Streptomyces cadmiisoli]AWW41865.1 hypothetical protein DN051_38870 [Streptomyces cadmiisoli]
MSAAAAGRVGRFYTAARRHPWVVGRVGDWKIPLGPYTPAQIVVAVGGGFVLFKSVSWWSWMGPIPIMVWVLAIWAVRHPKIKGLSPLHAALGWVLLGWQPRGGRIGGRAARDRTARPLHGAFTIEGGPAPARAGRASVPRAVRGRATEAAGPNPVAHHSALSRGPAPTVAERSVVPMTGVQQLLALTEQGGGAR